MSDEEYAPAKTKAPASLLDFLQFLAPVAKYYVLLMVAYFVAKRVNRALDEESALQDKEQLLQRPQLSKSLVGSSSEEEESSSEEEEETVDEELTTDGSGRLVKMAGDGESQVRERKSKKKKEKEAAKELFEGLQKIEKEMHEEAKEGKAANVSWNELHMGMLKRYKDKFPEHGPRIQTNDDYDDEFKELLKKHNIKAEDFRMQDGSEKPKDE